jgi:hypothetical protein
MSLEALIFDVDGTLAEKARFAPSILLAEA